MKVLQCDNHVLQLRPTHGWIFASIGVFILLMIPVWIYALGQTTTLTCSRTPFGSLRCALDRSLLGVALSHQPLRDMQGAYVDEYRDSDGDTVYRVMLRTAGGDTPLTQVSSSNYEPHAATVADIDHFISDNSRTALDVSVKGSLGLIIAGIDAVLGSGMILIGSGIAATTWTFDRRADTVTRRRASLLGAKVQTYTLSHIVDAQTVTHQDSDSGDMYRVELVTRSGPSIPLSSSYTIGYAGKERTAQVIREFLHR
jgi:hypothetical protein